MEHAQRLFLDDFSSDEIRKRELSPFERILNLTGQGENEMIKLLTPQGLVSVGECSSSDDGIPFWVRVHLDQIESPQPGDCYYDIGSRGVLRINGRLLEDYYRWMNDSEISNLRRSLAESLADFLETGVLVTPKQVESVAVQKFSLI